MPKTKLCFEIEFDGTYKQAENFQAKALASLQAIAVDCGGNPKKAQVIPVTLPDGKVRYDLVLPSQM